MSDLAERLRREEARMHKLHEYAIALRDKHSGQPAFTAFNDMQHGIAGRDPVLEPAADALDQRDRVIGELVEALDHCNKDVAALLATTEHPGHGGSPLEGFFERGEEIDALLAKAREITG